MYDINNVYLYEVFEEYRLASSETKNNIWKEFCETLWQVPNHRYKYINKLAYSISDEIEDSPYRSLFEEYNEIEYKTYKSTTKEKNSWYLLRQKLNNLYTNYCDKDICLRKDYFYELGTAKRLYYIWLSGVSFMTLYNLRIKIDESINNAENLKVKYGKQKMNLSWEQYKEIINEFLYKCFENYIPLCEKEDGVNITLNIDYWMEDNYVVKYLGNSINKYLKNYEKKEYHNVCRKNTRDKRIYKRCQKCGVLLLAKCNNRKFCDNCNAYIPMKSKIINCIDCGCNFEIDGIVKNKSRCDICQNKRNKLRYIKYNSKRKQPQL